MRRTPAGQGLQHLVQLAQGSLPRRRFLQGAATATIGAALPRASHAGPSQPSLDVGIVGAGLAGLACADELRKAGVAATVYEARDRVGGRCHSLRGFFPGQVAERGGELIDNPHKTMIGYARELGLGLEDLSKAPGEVRYFFDGAHHPESAVVDQFRALVSAMRGDLRTLSPEPSAAAHNAADVALDRTSLAEYLQTREAGSLVRQAIEEAYLAEYGLEADEQSCLNFLLFIHADRRSKFTPFGVFSDERYHIVQGNDAVATGLAARLPRPVRLGLTLERVRKTAAGRIELSFRSGRKSVIVTHDAVVLTVPFSVLRGVALDASLALPAWKIDAIQRLGFGTNAKTMIGFRGPYWADLGANGATYSDLLHHQATWETNPAAATSTRAILTDYASGDRGARLDPGRVDGQAALFLEDLERVLPGARANAARLPDGRLLAHLAHWPSDPLTRGSYTCYRPGEFTSIAGNEGKPIGNLFFAGEHTNSFYEWQGFMEGAALSGLDAATALLAGRK